MYKHSEKIFAVVAVLYAADFFESAQAQESLVLTTAASEPLSNSENTGVLEMQIKEVFRRVDIGLEIEHLTSERALINANKGIDDGNFARVGGLTRIYPNLIQVPENFMIYEFVAVSKNREIRIDGWESLQPYNLGYINGWKIVEKNTKNVKAVTKVKSVDELFRLLELDRVDVIVFSRLRTMAALQKTPVEGAVVLEPPIVRKPMFLYLNVKHKDLVPLLVDALRASKADGTHARLRREALQPYSVTH